MRFLLRYYIEYDHDNRYAIDRFALFAPNEKYRIRLKNKIKKLKRETRGATEGLIKRAFTDSISGPNCSNRFWDTRADHLTIKCRRMC